jgi:hypothetical protein
MKMNRKPRLIVASILLALAPLAVAQTTPPPAPTPPPTTTPPPAPTPTPVTTSSVPENRLADRFAAFFGSRENALAAVHALRTGTSATLVSTTPCATPCATPLPVTTTTLDVPTKPMGWGNVRHSLALAQFSLSQQGITNPTPQQITAALNGGTVTSGTGSTVELKGILTQRSGGMGWGQIAHAEGTTMGKVNHGLKPFNAVTTPPAPTPTPTPLPTTPKTTITTAAGTTSGSKVSAGKASSGIVTAGGGSAMASTAGRGIVTGNGGGVVASATGKGGGNANGHVHAGGASAGVGITTASNTAASTTVTTAQNAQASNRGGNGNGNGNGNGKGKGG